jgi:hypothetical protein
VRHDYRGLILGEGRCVFCLQIPHRLLRLTQPDVLRGSNGPNESVRQRLNFDVTRAEIRFRLSAKRTSPFKSAVGASVQSTTGSRGVRMSGSNAAYTMF